STSGSTGTGDRRRGRPVACCNLSGDVFQKNGDVSETALPGGFGAVEGVEGSSQVPGRTAPRECEAGLGELLPASQCAADQDGERPQDLPFPGAGGQQSSESSAGAGDVSECDRG